MLCVVGGVLGDLYGIRRPFEVAFFLYVVSTIYGAIFMPTEITNSDKAGTTTQKGGIAAFFAPIRVIVPHKYRLPSGKVITNYGLIFLAAGLFLGVVSKTQCCHTQKSWLALKGETKTITPSLPLAIARHYCSCTARPLSTGARSTMAI